ncbi:DUF4249 domain-containing protein [Nitritalea halalkaliphila]|uniref:DUF4249 domain-containing protein n=1 Tax=Nitritalea halalkaliphila TaxID=590849 RepID=UPI001EE65EE9|nr:DUF4249 domain-containing protein [Nitritalea halalkaliphila]
MVQRIFTIVFLFCCLSCIDPFEVEVEEGSRLLTVEGYITTAARAHQIRLTRSDTYGSIFQGSYAQWFRRRWLFAVVMVPSRFSQRWRRDFTKHPRPFALK